MRAYGRDDDDGGLADMQLCDAPVVSFSAGGAAFSAGSSAFSSSSTFSSSSSPSPHSPPPTPMPPPPSLPPFRLGHFPTPKAAHFPTPKAAHFPTPKAGLALTASYPADVPAVALPPLVLSRKRALSCPWLVCFTPSPPLKRQRSLRDSPPEVLAMESEPRLAARPASPPPPLAFERTPTPPSIPPAVVVHKALRRLVAEDAVPVYDRVVGPFARRHPPPRAPRPHSPRHHTWWQLYEAAAAACAAASAALPVADILAAASPHLAAWAAEQLSRLKQRTLSATERSLLAKLGLFET